MRGILLATMLALGCAAPVFHTGPTTLAKDERGYLGPRAGRGKGAFDRFWQSPNLGPWGLLQWDEQRASASRDSPADLLQTIRDELGRLNQRAAAGPNLQVAVTIYRFEKGGTFSKPTAYYEIVVRDPRGNVAWAADDSIVASDDMALSLVDPPSAIIAREMLRKIRDQFGI